MSVVVIGRNEAGYLPACIRSIREMDYPQDRLEVLYVDTDSTDRSPEVACALGVTVYEEHSDFPSPGRARNRGWREARYDIIHFVDGDMVIDPLYLRRAVKCLGRDNVACVIGWVEERDAPYHLISYVLQYPWKTKHPGYIEAPGAGGTFIRSVLVEVGGYNPDLHRCEETELGYRLRARGYRMLLLDHPMGIHDYGIRTFGALWTRYRGIGHSFARTLQRPPSASLEGERRAGARMLVQAVLFTLLSAGLVFTRLWWVIPLLPIALTAYVTVRYWQPRTYRALRIIYFILEYHLKPAIWLGMIQCFLRDGRSRYQCLVLR